jgi:hypothetical protein
LDPVAATPTGGAEVSARPDASAITPETSIHERLKAHLAPVAPPAPTAGEVAKPVKAAPEKAEAAPAETDDDETEIETEPKGDAQTDEETEASYESLSDLAEALGWDLDKIMDLEASTKIDGKEGRARLRDLIKSHQLEGHLNQKLMTHAEEKKAFETERQTFLQQTQHKIMQLDAGLQVAQKLLEGEFAQVDWQNLQNTDPLEFNQKYVAFQQRQAQLNQIANQLGQERQQSQQQAAQQQLAYRQEQQQLMETKIPEWSDSKVRERDIADMSVIAHQAYGITEQEVKGLTDHREILVLRDAMRWQKLQKSKPALLNKVKAAPRLLKPGTTQSRAEQASSSLKEGKAKLRQSGSLRDAQPLLKNILFKQ